MPKLSERLDLDAVPDEPRAIALVLHGGRERSRAATAPYQLAVLRMRPVATTLARAGAAHGLVVARLRFRVRGWNDAERSPVADATEALAELAARFGDLPVGLIGHSMGGRTALYAGGHPAVRTVVGLAPWVEPGDPSAQLAGRDVLMVHGDADRMTSPVESLRLARELSAAGTPVSYVSLRGAKHAMLQRPGLWHRLAAGYTVESLLGVPPRGTVGDAVANIVTEASAGHGPVVV